MMNTCTHYVFFSPTRFPGIYYTEQVLGLGRLSGGYVLEAELLRILDGYFRFVGPVGFAASDSTKVDARKAIEDFLRTRHGLV